MECGMCGALYDEDFMIPGKYGFGVCFDCAKKLITEIVEIFEKHELKPVIADMIAEKLAEAKLLRIESGL